MGRDGKGWRRITKGYKEQFESDGNVHWVDYDQRFMGVDINQNLANCNTLNVCQTIVAEG